MTPNESYPGQAPKDGVPQTGFALTREQKQAMLDDQFAELDRVGQTSFGGNEGAIDALVIIDKSVLGKKTAEPLRMPYQQTKLVPFDQLLARTHGGCHEVRSTGVSDVYGHKPMANQGRFGTQSSD